jgi:anti-sigma-K factor RskA
VEPQGIHELTAAYALNALDEDEERAYEDHLRHCDACREELASFLDTAAALAYGAEAPAPAPDLGDRIVEAALAERTNVVPLRRRWVGPALGAVAAVAAGVAIGLGIWASSLSSSLDEERREAAEQRDLVALFAGQDAERVPLEGANGTLVRSPGSGEAALVLTGLAPAPEGKTYQVWVIEDGAPQSAGLLEGGTETSVVRLDKPVGEGAVVALTVERDGGAEQPTTDPFAATPAV